MRLVEQEVDAAATPGVGIVVRSAWQRRLLTFLIVFGPGLIVMEADNDAGAVSTYMQAGGLYGLHILCLLVVLRGNLRVARGWRVYPPCASYRMMLVAQLGRKAIGTAADDCRHRARDDAGQTQKH